MCGRGTHGAAWRGGLSALVLCAGLADGCALLPPNSFIDPTKVGRFGLESGEGGIRRVLTPRDTPPGLAQATEPTPEDLAATYDDYRLAPGDALGVSIEDLIDYGRPFQMALEVSTLGEVRIPQLGSVRAAGLTERELEQELTARLKEAGVLPRPVVVVATQVKRGRLFTVLGAVRVPGPYPISDPDLRLLDALGMVGDADANAKKLYVVRRSAAGKALAPEAVPSAMPKEELIIPPPVDQDAPPGRSEPRPSGSGGLMTGVGLALQTEQDPGTQPSPTKDELREVIAPGGPKTQPATRAVPERPKAQFEPLIFDPATGRVIEPEPKAAPPEAKAAEPKAPPSPPRPAAPEEKLEEPFNWENVAERELEQRVIAIDRPELKNGNPRYNIVVRDRDVLNIPVDTGVFYLVGEIVRPGVYAFGGRDITIKQALAIGGGFTPLAWPQRCEVIRHEPGTDKQLTISVNLDAIYYGLEDDFYLRDDDIINVGTHFVAPFLYVIRNSFRFTYGFGFVYDRNFADQDSVGGRSNPEAVRQARRAARGLSF